MILGFIDPYQNLLVAQFSVNTWKNPPSHVKKNKFCHFYMRARYVSFAPEIGMRLETEE
jgi:hypothetical protein